MSKEFSARDFARHGDAGVGDLSVYRTLLESTKAIPWKIDWGTMQFAYIGPQIESLLGWEQDSWKSVEDWAARIHPDEREASVNLCVAQSQAGIDHEFDYRALTKDGDYVWIRDVVHVIRNADGSVDSLVGFMLDIGERKRMEQQLQDVQAELERQSQEDSLTGIANRRKFETVLHREWGAACVSGAPLSMLLLDIDFFKQYNDCYGHIGGDGCLARFAHILSGVASRPGDLAGRFGGEEFVILLPGTDLAGAEKLAAEFQAQLTAAAIPHRRSQIGEYLTASIGVGTVIPTAEREPAAFVSAVDALLYDAKKAGRNCVAAARL
jgi:diguanylate cyclase (GGDEF)-like protein/PAS domain S-box-containing protein